MGPSESVTGTAWREAPIPAGAWYVDAERPTRLVSPRGAVTPADEWSATWVQAVGLALLTTVPECTAGLRVVSGDRAVDES